MLRSYPPIRRPQGRDDDFSASKDPQFRGGPEDSNYSGPSPTAEALPGSVSPVQPSEPQHSVSRMTKLHDARTAPGR